ncbi:MAG: type II toxin-antitoxin system VapB family antitoxin [Candidatus Dormibacteraceae bacterium]
MSRTNIELDENLVGKIMTRYQIRTKRGAVQFALQRLVGEPLSQKAILQLEGTGWEGDLEEMRGSRFTQ